MEPVSKRDYDTQQRRQMADEGKALPDGSFPIADKTDLGNALQSIGRAKNRSLALAHIRRRAKDLDAMDMLPEWAMAKGVSTPLSVALGVLLADTYSVYHEAHGFHWNVRGADFSQYHDLFAEISDDIYGSVDPIAENMLKINADAPFRMNELATMRTIPESAPATDPQSMAEALLKQVEGLLNTLTRTFDVANNQNEQGIANFLAERIDMTQKWAWQLRASTGMQKADRLALERLRPNTDASAAEWDLLVKAVIKAGGIRNVSGYAKDLLEKAAKQSFGGNRSAAGAYAASIRWGNRGGAKGGGSTAAASGSSSEGPSMAVGSMKDQVDADYEDAQRQGVAQFYRPAGSGTNIRPSHYEAIASGHIDRIATVIAQDHRDQGKKVSPALRPYLDAMYHVRSVNDNYGMDSGKSIVAYALSNMSSYKGETAKAVKARLKQLLKG